MTSLWKYWGGRGGSRIKYRVYTKKAPMLKMLPVRRSARMPVALLNSAKQKHPKIDVFMRRKLPNIFYSPPLDHLDHTLASVPYENVEEGRCGCSYFGGGGFVSSKLEVFPWHSRYTLVERCQFFFSIPEFQGKGNDYGRRVCSFFSCRYVIQSPRERF